MTFDMAHYFIWLCSALAILLFRFIARLFDSTTTLIMVHLHNGPLTRFHTCTGDLM